MVQYGLLSTGVSQTLDNLTYSYQPGSNQLSGVTDNARNDASEQLGDFQDRHARSGDYSYDANGNLTQDLNKNIANIQYNYLNLPEQITITGKGAIRYLYDAAGNKLLKRTVDNTAGKSTVTTYIGSEVFQSSYSNGGTPGVDTLQFFGTTEGRAGGSPSGVGGFVYDYFLKDHLGNTRMVITDDYNIASPILETTSYYPFESQMAGISLQAVTHAQQNKKL